MGKIHKHSCLKKCLAFSGGFSLVSIYYYFLLKDIPLLQPLGLYLCLFLSITLGIVNVKSIQVRCISVLILPMYCGKPGRGVLKALLLTYVVAGPITNMALNAREVVRVFGCTTQLSENISKIHYTQIVEPLRQALLSLGPEIDEVKDTIRYTYAILAPIEQEMESSKEVEIIRQAIECISEIFNDTRVRNIEEKFRKYENINIDFYQKQYLKKLEYRCESQLAHGAAQCMEVFAPAYEMCHKIVPFDSAFITCEPLKFTNVCNVKKIVGWDVCDSKTQADPRLVEQYVRLKNTAHRTAANLSHIMLQYRIHYVTELCDVQDAKETAERVRHAFEQKYRIMKAVVTFVNIYLALLYLRIVVAAQTYHDRYLTNIEYDNVYITSYFKKIDKKRSRRNQYSLLPLKKMERTKFIDVHSFAYIPSERSKLFTQILKVMLEVVTATTFVMLDRLFFEALDAVRHHAQVVSEDNEGHVKFDIEGTGAIASMVRKVVHGLSTNKRVPPISSEMCLPHPRAMPMIFYVKIYGGYIWILILLYINPNTLRMRRIICSYFYPHREKQRILHLYNDILKKRIKLEKTLRRNAVQAIRAHYLSGENLLSLRIKYPQVVGWLTVLPFARMKCLICGDTEPRSSDCAPYGWHSCVSMKCPFVYCGECWREIGSRCLACDPRLAELSDVDSLSDDEPRDR